MKKLILITLIITGLLTSFNTNAQFLKDAKKFVEKKTGVTGLSEKDAADGIREALVKGTGESVKLVTNVDGYLGNPEIKIPFPPDAKQMETKLRALGMGTKVDRFNESMNRGAEKAAKEATPIFVNAIKNMTVNDAFKIIKGENNAATSYLKNNTSRELNIKFQPIIKSSLDEVNASKYWEELVTAYNAIPFVKKMNPNLTEYVTGKAIDGLFVMVAKEELKIRKDPVARTTELLKKVFGN